MKLKVSYMTDVNPAAISLVKSSPVKSSIKEALSG